MTTKSATADLLPPRVRSIVYVVSVMAAAAYATVEANVDIPWPGMAAYAAWNAGVGLLAAANTMTNSPQPVPDEGNQP